MWRFSLQVMGSNQQNKIFPLYPHFQYRSVEELPRTTKSRYSFARIDIIKDICYTQIHVLDNISVQNSGSSPPTLGST